MSKSPRALRRLAGAFFWYLLVLPRRLGQIALAARFDVVFIQRGLFRPHSPPVLELLLAAVCRLARRPVVYHFDDALQTLGRPGYTARRLRLADVVLTGSVENVRYAQSVGVDAQLLVGWVDARRYPVVQHGARTSTVVGWIGHFPDRLLPLLPVFECLHQQEGIVLRIVTDERRRPEFARPWVAWERWALEDEFTYFAGFDIGVMPLTDSAYNRGKESFKLKEYMASGLPTVSSPVGNNLDVVVDEVTGFFATGDTEWFAKLRELAVSPALRSRMGAEARRIALERFGGETLIPRFVELLETVCRKHEDRAAPGRAHR